MVKYFLRVHTLFKLYQNTHTQNRQFCIYTTEPVAQNIRIGINWNRSQKDSSVKISLAIDIKEAEKQVALNHKGLYKEVTRAPSDRMIADKNLWQTLRANKTADIEIGTVVG